MDDLIKSYIDRAAFASDTEFAKQQLAELLAAYTKVKEARTNLGPATGTANIVSGAQDATVAVKTMTAALVAQNQVIGQTAQIYNAQSASLQQNIKNLNEYKKALSDNSILQKQAIKDLESGRISADEYQDKISKLTEAQFRYKQAISDTTKEIKLQTLLNVAPPTSILEAQTQNKQLTTQRNLLPATDIEGIKQLNDLIDRNNKLIDENSDKLARQKINVGNYGPSVKAALSVLEEELTKVNEQLSVTDRNSDAFQVLSQQANLLKSVANGLDKTFTSSRQELTALQEAAKKVGTEFGITSEEFQKFAAQIGERKKDLAEIQAAINFQANPIKNLDAILGGIQAITGAFGAYKSIVALTGEGNEELQKSMVKLQAVMTLVTSVQSVANALQTDGAAIQGLLALKAKILSAAQEIVAVASGKATAALTGETVAAGTAATAVEGLATSEVAASAGGEAITATSAEAATAIGGEAVAAGSLAVGLDAAAGSEAAVAVGATTMAEAIAATGIGLIIIGISVAVYKVVESIRDWNKANDSVKKANDDLVKSLKDLLDATNNYNNILGEFTKRQLDSIDKRIAKQKALGVSQEQSLALDQKATAAHLKAANEALAQNNITLKSINDQNAAASNSAAIVQAAEERKAKYIQQTGDRTKAVADAQALLQKIESGEADLNIENLQKIAAIGDKDYAEKIKRFDDEIAKEKAKADLDAATYKSDADKYNAAQALKAQSDQQAAQASALSIQDRIKYEQQAATIEAQIETDKNNKILNSDYSTFDERLAALKDNLAQQKKVIEADNKAVQSDPTASVTDKNIAPKKANADLLSAETDSQQAIFKLKEEYRLRDLSAVTEVQKSIYNTVAQTNEDIYNNDALTEAQRLTALKKSIEARKAVLDAQYNNDLSNAGISDPDIERIKQEGFFEISNKKITDDELKKLVADYNSSVVALSKDSATERIKIEKDYYEQYAYESDKALRKIQRENDENANSQEDVYNKNIIALNDSYSQGLISTEKYNHDRVKLDDNYAKQSLKIQIDNIEKTLAATQSAAEVEARLQKELNDLKSQDSTKLTDDEQKVHDDRIKQVTDELKAIQDAVGKEADLYKQLSKLRKDLSGEEKKELDEQKQRYIDLFNSIKEAGDNILDTVSKAVNAGVIAQKNALQEQSDQIDANSAREIDLINASVLAEQDKANKIAIITARTQAQKDLIAQKQRQADEREARAEKEKAIFDIILNTAIGIAKAWGNPIKIAYVAALGAAELAIAIATPIPKFKYGKDNDYEGPAIVGDGGKSEVIKRADGTLELTPARDTLTYLNKDDVVFPDLREFMLRNAMPKLKSAPVNNNLELAVENQTKILRPILNKIASKRELQLGATDKGMAAIWRHGANQTKYISENTNW